MLSGEKNHQIPIKIPMYIHIKNYRCYESISKVVRKNVVSDNFTLCRREVFIPQKSKKEKVNTLKVFRMSL